MTEELLAFKAYVATIDETQPDTTIAAQLGEAKSLLAHAALSLPCVRRVEHRNTLLNDTLKAVNRVSVARGISILKDLGLWKPNRPITDRRY